MELYSQLWTNKYHSNTKNSNLQYKHLEFNGQRQQGGSPADPHYFVLSLEKHKNWQKRLGKEQQLCSKRLVTTFDTRTHFYIINL